MGTQKEQTHQKMQVAQELLYKYVPEIDNVVIYEGQGDSSNFSSVSTPHYTYTHVVLVPVSERKRDVLFPQPAGAVPTVFKATEAMRQPLKGEKQVVQDSS